MAEDFGDRDDVAGRGDSIGEAESRRNEEQKLRDNQGGSELTDRPEANPVGAPGETASAEAAGAPPSTIASPPLQPPARRATGDVTAPVRSAGPAEATLPEQSPLTGPRRWAPEDVRRGHAADVAPGRIPKPEERGE